MQVSRRELSASDAPCLLSLSRLAPGRVQGAAVVEAGGLRRRAWGDMGRRWGPRLGTTPPLHNPTKTAPPSNSLIASLGHVPCACPECVTGLCVVCSVLCRCGRSWPCRSSSPSPTPRGSHSSGSPSLQVSSSSDHQVPTHDTPWPWCLRRKQEPRPPVDQTTQLADRRRKRGFVRRRGEGFVRSFFR